MTSVFCIDITRVNAFVPSLIIVTFMYPLMTRISRIYLMVLVKWVGPTPVVCDGLDFSGLVYCHVCIFRVVASPDLYDPRP